MRATKGEKRGNKGKTNKKTRSKRANQEDEHAGKHKHSLILRYSRSRLSCECVQTVVKPALFLVFIAVFVCIDSSCRNAELASAENRKQKSGQQLTEETRTLRPIFSLSQEVQRLFIVHW